jgi:hypothetical protein
MISIIEFHVSILHGYVNCFEKDEKIISNADKSTRLAFFHEVFMAKKLYPLAWLCLAATTFFFSCAATPPARETPPETIPQIAQAGTASVSGGIPVRPVKPPVPENIMGTGLVSPKDMAAFLLGNNPGAGKDFVDNFALFYAEEAAIERVNHDVAFAQMCLETGFLRFGNLVKPEQNNFAGLGAIGPGQPGLSFPNARIGVRAHIQHLKAYATDAPLNQELVNPRYRFVRLGSSPTIQGLAGTWAADRSYAEKINNILERLYSFVYESVDIGTTLTPSGR